MYYAETEMDGIGDAIKAVGGQVKLAQMLGVTQQAVSAWLRRGWVPAGRIVEVEQVTGVPRDRLVKPQLASLLETNCF